MQIETRASLAALLAGLSVVGASYGVSALVVGAQKAQDGHAAADLTRAAETPGAGAPVINAAFVAQGHTLYTQSCASCHGTSGANGYAPSLRNGNLSGAKIALRIKNGVAGQMPAFGGKYSAAQQQALVAYVQSLK